MSKTEIPTVTDRVQAVADFVPERLSWVVAESRTANEWGGYDWALRNGKQLRLVQEDTGSPNVEWYLFGPAPARLHVAGAQVDGAVHAEMVAAIADALRARHSMSAQQRTVTEPWENTQKRVTQGGVYPWSVTLKQGCVVQTETFYHREEAEALHEKALAAGFAQV